MNILITGGAGFIGSNLAEFHLKKGDEVYCIDNFITGLKENIDAVQANPLFHFTEADIVEYDFSSIPSADFVYHLASPASPVQYKKHPVETLRVNSEGTYNVLEYMKKTGSKSFVMASTSEVYGDPEVHPQNESYWGNVNPLGIRSCYDESKRYAESLTMSYFRKFDLNVRIARIFNTYGPNMEQNDGRVISNFIMQALTDKPITVYGKGMQTRSFCFVSDMVQALYSLAVTPGISGEVFNLGNPEEYTMLQLAQIIQNKTATVSDIIFTPIDEDDPKRRKPDISKANKTLGWVPRISLDKGLDTTISYFKKRFL